MPTPDSSELEYLRHSAAHLLAAAVLELWPQAKLTLGPATGDGFYYDIDFGSEKLSEDALSRIEKRMKALVRGWKEFSHREVTEEDAKAWAGGNQYKLELIDEIAGRGDPITLYTVGDFTDLCRGGHVAHPSKALKHFKLLKVAGAYWRGDENNTMLTRIYGTAFPTSDELNNYVHNLEEAKRRDHRKLGKALDLFTFSPLVGAGLPLFTPRGTIIREELTKFLWDLQTTYGYQRTDIPHLAKPELYKMSGHWDKFGDSLFHVRGKGDEAFVVKPMNCPHHTQLFASKPRSYRDLPIRLAEVTKVYRDEQAGELLGLARVRSITQDDAHVFCTRDHMLQEIAHAMAIIRDFYAPFAFELKIRLSLRDPKNSDAYLGTPEIWQDAEEALRAGLRESGVDFVEEEGEAAFYGPKIDYTAVDSLQRDWQLATVQLDFNMPERFGLTYTDADGREQVPIMIHRAISGAQERFIAVLLEHYAGALPLWLSPVQVAVLPISDDQTAYATEVAQQLAAAGIRSDLDDRSESIGKKIREAEMLKVPVMLIVGKQEVAEQKVAKRTRESRDEGLVSMTDVISELQRAIAERSS